MEVSWLSCKRGSIARLGTSLSRARPSAFDRAAGQGAELDRVENVNFLAFGGNQLVLLEAGEDPGHGFHRQAR